MTSTPAPRGSAVLELVEVMDRLRSPGGCPWDAEQTHASLAPYLVEETYETIDAIDSGDLTHLAEELGDVLLQVVFHARVGQEHPSEPFDIDEVARGIAAKLRRRHPHVFADVVATTPEQVAANWTQIKASERAAAGAPADADPLRRIPVSMPPLARAARVVNALDGAGASGRLDARADESDPGGRLLALVAELVRAGLDPDQVLRSALADLGR